MPIDYDIEPGLIAVRIHGQLTTEEFEEYLAETERDDRYHPELPRLVILTDDATFPPSAEIIKSAARMPDRGMGPNIRFACVATAPLAIGIASMFMGNAGLGANYRLFEDVEQAREWLRGHA
jgi:hypothetical protein